MDAIDFIKIDQELTIDKVADYFVTELFDDP